MLAKIFVIFGLCLLFALGLVLTLSFTYLNLLPRYVQILSITRIACPIFLYNLNHPWGLKYRYAVQILNATLLYLLYLHISVTRPIEFYFMACVEIVYAM